MTSSEPWSVSIKLYADHDVVEIIQCGLGAEYGQLDNCVVTGGTIDATSEDMVVRS